MQSKMSLLRHWLGKLIYGLLPAALANLIGGVLLAHLQWSYAPAPVAATTPASPEMMQVLRDEHGLLADFLAASLDNQKKQLGADENAPLAVGHGQEVTVAARPPVIVMASTKPITSHDRPTVVRTSLPPLVITELQPSEGAKPAARNDASLFAKTIGIKDDVVAATQRVVSVISGIPSWIGALGDRIGGNSANPRPPADLVSAS